MNGEGVFLPDPIRHRMGRHATDITEGRWISSPQSLNVIQHVQSVLHGKSIINAFYINCLLELRIKLN